MTGADTRGVPPAGRRISDRVEAPEADLREVAAREPAQVAEDIMRVPTAEEIADAIARANRALAEIRARELLDTQEAAEHRAAQLTRWATDDHTLHAEPPAHTADHDLALDRSDR